MSKKYICCSTLSKLALSKNIWYFLKVTGEIYMADIRRLREQLAQLDAQKQGIYTKLNETKRKNATGRKVLLGVHLLKLAESDALVHSALVKVWAAAQTERPSAFVDADMPKAP